MNYSLIGYIIGWILTVEALFMLLPIIVAIVYGETSGWAFVIVFIFEIIIGLILKRKPPKRRNFFTRDGFATVALSWIIISIVGSLPFVISGAIPNFVDALFETVSGFTTTGASILPEVESLPKCILFWRSFTHWIGGMGVLVFILSILPMVGGSYMSLMKAESPGPSVGKLAPKIRTTAMILYVIYIVMSLTEFIFLIAGKMSFFDAITTTFGTAGTGGFGIKNDSLGSYSPYIQNVVTVFMLLFGVNFNIYFWIITKKPRQILKCEEVRVYFAIVFSSIAIIAYNIRDLFPTINESIRHAAFQVASIITTTGYATTDFNIWPEVSRTILVVLMFIGACAGSTGGGIKVSRILILFKTIKKELYQIIHPHSVKRIKLDGHLVEHEVVRSANVFLITYVLIFTVSVLFLVFDGLDIVTNFTAVAATLNNIGPGLELVGPTQNFAVFSTEAKLVLIFDMLAGRLELFPMLIIFVPEMWKKR